MKRTARGFTLIEAALATGFVGVLLVSATATFGTIAKASAGQTESRRAMLLGQHLMSEILRSDFQQAGVPAPFGPQSGQTRATFDAVDCYDGYAASPPVSQANAALADFAGWSQRVSVAFVDPASPGSVAAASTLKRVIVTTVAPGGRAYTLTGYRSKFGATEWTPAAQSTLVTGVTVAVQGVAPGRPVVTGAHPLNVTKP